MRAAPRREDFKGTPRHELHRPTAIQANVRHLGAAVELAGTFRSLLLSALLC